MAWPGGAVDAEEELAAAGLWEADAEAGSEVALDFSGMAAAIHLRYMCDGVARAWEATHRMR